VAEDKATWRILGAICGRSILDERIFDMRFSEAFWKVVMGQRVGLSDIRSLNGGLMRTMSDMQALANKYQLSLGKVVGNPAGFDELKSSLTFNGVKIEDLCLLFTLPGFDDYELLPGGLKKEVTLDNLELYVDLVVKTYLVDSILPYVEAFREGLNTVVASHAVRPARKARLLPAPRARARGLRHKAGAVDCTVPQGNDLPHARLPRWQPDLRELPRSPL
jgi:E3 ubiquitin-protein ligase TRIP12